MRTLAPMGLSPNFAAERRRDAMRLLMLPLLLILAVSPTSVSQTTEPFQAPSPDARKLLDRALAKAKAQNKTVLVWFSAPW
jgi:hypothetical protein